MRVKMLAGGSVVAMSMRLGFQRDRNEAHLPVRDAALGNDALGEVSHRLGLPMQNRHLETIFMVEMHMHGRNMEMMVIVMRAGQPFRQFAGMVVKHVRERGKALAVLSEESRACWRPSRARSRKASERLA